MTDAATRTGDVRPGDTIVLLADSPESADGPTDVLRLVHVDEAMSPLTDDVDRHGARRPAALARPTDG